MLAMVVLEQRNATDSLRTLRDVVFRQVPAHADLLHGSTHLASAQQHFDHYDQRERITPEQILEPLEILASLLPDLESEGGPATRAARQLRLNFLAYLEEEAIGPAGDGALTLESQLLQQVATLSSAVSSLPVPRTTATSHPQLPVKRFSDQVEASLVSYLNRSRYHLEPVLSLLESALVPFPLNNNENK